MTDIIRILVADDHEIVRQGLINLLSDEPWIIIVGEAANGREALKKAIELKPEIVVIDIGMPELNGIEATKQILQQTNCKVIALTIHNNIQYVQEMIKIGASGYLLKDCAVDELVDAINNISDSKYYLSKTISEHLQKYSNQKIPVNSILLKEILSDREKEILQLLAEGNSTKTIADKLFISPKTVETHRKNIMDKLGLYSISDLTRYAIRIGLVHLD